MKYFFFQPSSHFYCVGLIAASLNYAIIIIILENLQKKVLLGLKKYADVENDAMIANGNVRQEMEREICNVMGRSWRFLISVVL